MPTDPAPSPENPDSRTEFILENARAGNQQAWHELFTRYRSMLLVAVEYRMPGFLRRPYDAEDVLQEAFHKVYARIDAFEYQGEGSFRRWLRKIVLRELEIIRKSENADRRRPPNENAGSQFLSAKETNDPRPSQILNDIEEREGMMELLRGMSEEDQEIVSMRIFEGKTWSEVGEVLGCGRDMAKVRFDRTIESLSRCLD